MTEGKKQENKSIAGGQDIPLWKEVLRRLASPRVWFYPILALLLALFLLPRLAERSSAPMKPASSPASPETTLPAKGGPADRGSDGRKRSWNEKNRPPDPFGNEGGHGLIMVNFMTDLKKDRDPNQDPAR